MLKCASIIYDFRLFNSKKKNNHKMTKKAIKMSFRTKWVEKTVKIKIIAVTTDTCFQGA